MKKRTYPIIFLVVLFSVATNAQSLIYTRVPDVSTASYSQNYFVAPDVGTTARDVVFNNDGSKMYVLSRSDVDEYSLTTEYDLSSASFVDDYSFSTQESEAAGLAFSKDGMQMFVVGLDAEVYEYDLTVAFSVSAVNYVQAFDVSNEDNDPEGLAFNNDGTKMYVAGDIGNSVYEYTLSSGFDVSTASYSQTYSVASEETIPTSIAFNLDGSEMFIVGYAGGAPKVTSYSLNTPFDISTASANQSFDVSDEDGIPVGLAFNDKGTKMYVADAQDDFVSEYDLSSTPFVETSLDNGSVEGSIIIGIDGDTFVNSGGSLTTPTHFTIDNLPSAFSSSISVDGNGEIATVSLSGSANVHINSYDLAGLEFTFTDAAFTTSMASNVTNAVGANSGLGIDFNDPLQITYSTTPDISTAKYSGLSFSLSTNVASPEALTFSHNGTKMFTIRTANYTVYEYTLGTPFDITTADYTTEIAVNPQEFDPQGVAFNNDGSKLYIVGGVAGISQYDLIEPYAISTATLSTSYAVSGQEASPRDVSFSRSGDKMFVIGETSDQVHEYALNSPFDISIVTYTTSFSIANEDTSPKSLAFNKDGTRMYFAGDIGERVYAYELTTGFDLTTASFLNSYYVATEATFITGVAFSSSGDKMFISNRLDNFVFQYDLSPAAFSETESNDGSVEGALFICLSGDTFINAGSNLSSLTDYTVENLPNGFSPSITVSDDGKLGTLIITGNASDHEDVNDITDLQFTFTDDAFTNSVASDIENATGPANSDLGIDFDDVLIPELSYSLTPDISTAEFRTFKDLPAEQRESGIAFSRDGLKMFTAGSGGLYEHSLSSAFAVTTSSLVENYPNLGHVTFSYDGLRMYLLGSGDKVLEYALGSPYDLSAINLVDEFDISGQTGNAITISFNNDGSKMYVIEYDRDIFEYNLSTPFSISTAIFNTSVSPGEPPGTPPQGFKFSRDGKKLYITDNLRMAEFDLSTPFLTSTLSLNIVHQPSHGIDEFAFNTDGTEILYGGVAWYSLSNEAFTVIPQQGSIDGSLIVSIIHDTFVNPGGTLTSPAHFSIPNLPAGLTPTMEVGADGLTATLVLAGIPTVFDNISDLQFTFTDAAFVNSDASFVENAIDASSELGINIEVAELSYSATTFGETIENDGAVEGSMTITVTGDTFVNADGNLEAGTHYNLGDVPSGLGSSMTVSSDGLSATLTLTGNSDNHNNIHSVSDIKVSFTDAAFTNSEAIYVVNSTDASTGTGIDFIEATVVIISQTPVDGTTDVSLSSEISMTFNTDIFPGEGIIYVKNVVTDQSHYSANMSDIINAPVTITGATLTLNSVNLQQGSEYYIEIPQGAVKDADGNIFGGITDNTTWNITTIDQDGPWIGQLASEDSWQSLDENGEVLLAGRLFEVIDIHDNITPFEDLIITFSPESLDCDDIGTPQTVSISATDEAGFTTTRDVTVSVFDDLAPISIGKNISLTVSSGEIVTLSPDDVDDGSTDNCGIFSTSLSKSSFSTADVGENTVTLTIEDIVGNTSTADIIVTVVLDNQTPTISDQSFTIEENISGGVLVADIVATDPDGDALTFTITAGNTGDAFAFNELSPDQLVPDNIAAINFETNPVFTLTVEVSDGNGGTATATITINLVDVNDNPDVEPQSFTVDVNSPNGTIIGAVLATDEDGDPLTYSIIGESHAFGIDAITGELSVIDNTKLDIQELEEVTINVQVSDDQGDSGSAEITVITVDLNTAPEISDQTFTIDENSSEGTTVGTVSGSDADGDVLTYSITGGNTDDAFTINSSTGELSVNSKSALDFETTPTFTLTVEVSDGKGGMASATITINLNDMDPEVLGLLDESEIMIYPNPVSDRLMVHFDQTQESLKLELTDLSGRLVRRNQYRQVEGIIELSVDHLKQGVYMLGIEMDGEVEYFRIVKH